MTKPQIFRTLRHEPGFALAFVVTLGLGIGANTAIFSLVSGILLRPLPYPHADRLVMVQQPATRQGEDDMRFSFVEIDDYRQQTTTLEQLVEFGDWTFNVLGRGEPHRAVAGLVSANFFEVLGLQPLYGRTLRPEDQPRNAKPVVVLTYDYWQRELGGDPAVVGQTLDLTAKKAEIVGILAPGVHYASGGRRQDFYANYACNDHYVSAAMQDDRDHRMTTVFARLAPGATVEAAQADLRRIAASLRQQFPKAYPEDLGLDVTVTRWQEQLVRQARPILWTILAGAVLVLLIACANVANLTMVRSMRRAREMSLRSALGGSTWRIRSAFFLENLGLALLGAGLGIVIAYGLLGVLVAYASRLTTRTSEIAIDLRVLGFTLLIACACAAAFALLPGTGPGRRLAESLAGTSSRGGGSLSRARAQKLLVVGQLAISFLLLFGSILLGRTLLNLYAVDPGFDLDHVLTVEAPNFRTQVPQQELRAFNDQAVAEVGGIAGVEHAAMSMTEPLGASTTPLTIQVRGSAEADQAHAVPTVFGAVTAGYFEALGVHLVRGRFFTTQDGPEAEKVALLNESAAHYYFGDEDPIGQQVNYDFGGFFGGKSDWMTVVGVVADTRDTGIAEDAMHALYLPSAQSFASDTMLVRTANDPHQVASQVIDRLRALDPNRPLEHIRTLAEARDENVAPWRLNAILFGSFTALALLIATVGVAAMLMWSVSVRRRELAIRAAVGAEPARLLRAVLLEGTLLVAIGLALGSGAALAVGRYLQSLLFEVQAGDALTLTLSCTVLLAIGLAAALWPALRAMRSNPIEILRAD